MLVKTQLLILDDWGMKTQALSARYLFEVMDDRFGCGSTFVISQLPTDQRHATIGENTLADAIVNITFKLTHFHQNHHFRIDPPPV